MSLDLLDFRRAMLDLYRQVRDMAAIDPYKAWTFWRSTRDEIFAHHPQSALPEAKRAAFKGLSYFDYDPALRFTVILEPAEAAIALPITTSAQGSMVFSALGTMHLPIGTLTLYWLSDYAGGIFLPFRDMTSGHATYGGGRYLLDTAKGADLGSAPDGGLMLDFNFAYHPSCHYDSRWTCPLSPLENRLDVAIEAGERFFEG